MSGGYAQAASTAADRPGAQPLAAAHAALRADPSVQFSLPRAAFPKPPEMPHWLKAFFRWLGELLRPIGRMLRWLNAHMPNAPYARILLWTVLGFAAAALAWAVYQRIHDGEWRLPRRRRRPNVAVDLTGEDDAPPETAVRAWLREADALAAQGRFAEAAHHLLFRSIEDLARRRPRLVRPALTSRELASADGVPAAARTLFARIAGLVERSLFGGRPVDAADWQQARAAYTEFALPGAWAT